MRKTSLSITMPHDAVARLHRLFEGWAVIIACPPTPAEPSSLLARGRVSAILTHDAGAVWPDAAGVCLASETLAAGGVVGIAFPRLADALACRLRLQKEGAADA
jgi:hypothetical protein